MTAQKNSVESSPPTQTSKKTNSIISNKNAGKHQKQAIDVKELLLQIELLGYTKQDNLFDQAVYLRGFLPSTHPNKSTDKGRKATVKNINQLTETVSEWQAQGRGCYVVVNGGHTDKEVQSCRSIFFEHDNLDKDIQRDLWQRLNLPEPTFQVDTGGKSIHSYWVFRWPITIEQWRSLQTDLLEYADADRSLKNPSRVMRLAGCVHAETGEQSKVISQSKRLYTFSHLRGVIPSPKKSTTPTIPLPAGDMPLYQCLSKSDRSLIDDGQVSPGRNTAGAKLARNLIGTAARLNYLGHRYDGHPRSLFDDFCARCSPPLDDREADAIWRSAEKDNPTATLTDDALENCFKSWQRQGTNNQSPKTDTHPPNATASPKRLDPVDVTQSVINALNKLIEQDLPSSQVEVRLPEIADIFGRGVGDVRRVYDALVKERRQVEEQQENGQQLPFLLEAQQARLNPKDLFWGDGGKIAQLLTSVAAAMPTSVENLITTLIPVAGSRIGTSARIVINPASRYTQPAIYWSCIVAPTGRLKSPAQEVIIRPLCKLEADEFRWWKLAQEDFERELKSYKKNSDTEPPEPPASRRRFLVQSATSETRIKVHSENPRGLLNYRDEWSSFINGRNKYRNGKGDDLELDLSEFNGAAILKDNSGESFFIERSAISRTGNTQPETLQKFLSAQNYEDCTGEFARWLFCLVPGEVAYIDLFKDGDDAGQLLEEALCNLYRQLDRLPEKDYFLSDGAKGVFQMYHRWLTDAEVNEPHPGIRAAYPKIKSYFARLALWLHIVNAALGGDEPAQIISGATMYSACTLTNFYLTQAKLLYNSSGDKKLSGELLKIKEYIEKRDGGVTSREVHKGIFSLRKRPPAEVSAMCHTLCDLGFSNTDGKKFYPLSKNIGNIGTFPETTAATGFDPADLGSAKIGKHPHFFLDNESAKSDSQVDSPKNSQSSSQDDKSVKSADAADQLPINDRQGLSQPQQAFQEIADAADQFSEKLKIKNSDNNHEANTENPAQQRLQAIQRQSTSDGHDDTSQIPVGIWVRYEEKLAQVTGYFDANKLNLDGQDKSQIFGSYESEKCQALTAHEMLALGLSTKLTGLDISKTPCFLEGSYYYSQSLRARVKLIQIIEEGKFFKNPEALVKPDKISPQRVKLEELRACHDSPAASFANGDVVIACTGFANGQPSARAGVVEKQDFLWVWVKFANENGDRFTRPQAFYAHRVVKE